jgi:glutathione S-transferase
MIKIYGRTNAWNVRKVLLLLEDIGLPYERFDYGRGFKAANSPEFLALNPNAMVPVLADGDTVMWESHTILRYLAAKFAPESYYPRDLVHRAAADQWLDWKIAQVAVVIRPLFFRLFLKMGDYTDREVEACETECAKLFTILDGQLGS